MSSHVPGSSLSPPFIYFIFSPAGGEGEVGRSCSGRHSAGSAVPRGQQLPRLQPVLNFYFH